MASPNGETRRQFLQLMGASLALAGLGTLGSGCRRPDEKIYPFAKAHEEYVPGVPQYFATSMPTRDGAVPLLARSHDGRPTKIEGNPEHPDSNGSTDLLAQASILDLYDPDRARRYLHEGKEVIKEAALDFLGSLSKQYTANGGAGLCVLTEPSSSPSRARLETEIRKKLPKARWFTHEATDSTTARQAASLLAGRPVVPYPRLDRAKVVLSLDCDFLGTEADALRHQKAFAAARHVTKPGQSMNRLYVVEALMTQTGINADHRLRIPAGTVLTVGAAVAAQAAPADTALQALANRFSPPQSVRPAWLTECAKDLAAHRGASLVLAGERQPLAVHLLAGLLNAALGNIGETLLLLEAPSVPAAEPVESLAQAMTQGQVETLLILGPNPAYTAPASLNWLKPSGGQARPGTTIIRLGSHEDETSDFCHWHLPAAHYLESWGDARTSDGTVVGLQPLIQPLFDGLTELEVLARLGGLEPHKPDAIVRATFQALTDGQDSEERWKKFLHDGFLAGSAARAVPVQVNPAVAQPIFAATQPPTPPSRDRLELVLYRDSKMNDGRQANNGWLQELPDPVTKLTWDNAVLVSRRTAQELGLQNNQVVEIAMEGRPTLTGPIWIQPGLADGTVGVALGYGRRRAGRVGNFNGGQVGFDAFKIRASSSEHLVVGVRLVPARRQYSLACAQDHWSMEGRPIVREVTLGQFAAQPTLAGGAPGEARPAGEAGRSPALPLYPNPLDHLKQTALHQWGMVIDLNRCIGCSACVLACQSENNIPIVGKEQVAKGREMHWLRLDRYYTGGPSRPETATRSVQSHARQAAEPWIDDPHVVTQPVMCQHCEAAPCENVCPVNATAHDREGLNVMVYNRCVGTRYCSNNCPYKVRRFNFFDYHKRPLERLYQGPLAQRPQEEWDLLALARNPDVSVRMRGVMEKCTFCGQRIEQAKIAQKVQAGESDRVVVPEGVIKTACQQACPTGAIVFGNLADPNNLVSQQRAQPRAYALLERLNTKPRVTYLAKLRNPNPALAET